MAHPFTILFGNCLYSFMERAMRLYFLNNEEPVLARVCSVGSKVGKPCFSTRGVVVSVQWPRRYRIVQTNIINGILDVEMEATVSFNGHLDGSIRMYNYDLGGYVTSTDQMLVDDWCTEILEDMRESGGPAQYWDAPNSGKRFTWPQTRK